MSIPFKISYILLIIIITCLIFPPAMCMAKTSYSIHIAFGGVACGGVFLYLYLVHYSGLDLELPQMGQALMNIRGDRIMWGLPSIDYVQSLSETPSISLKNDYYLRLIKWEF